MKLHSNPEKLITNNKLVVQREYYENGQLHYEYYLNGERHNPNGPAISSWHSNGQLWCESYYLNGELHNPNGPAYRRWLGSGELLCEEYYLNDNFYSKTHFDKAIKSAKLT